MINYKKIICFVSFGLFISLSASGQEREPDTINAPSEIISSEFLTLKQTNPYELKVISHLRNSGSVHYTAKIMEEDSPVFVFEECVGGRLPFPENGYYEITCVAGQDYLFIAGTSRQVDEFSATWGRADKKPIEFSSLQLLHP